MREGDLARLQSGFIDNVLFGGEDEPDWSVGRICCRGLVIIVGEKIWL